VTAEEYLRKKHDDAMADICAALRMIAERDATIKELAEKLAAFEKKPKEEL